MWHVKFYSRLLKRQDLISLCVEASTSSILWLVLINEYDRLLHSRYFFSLPIIIVLKIINSVNHLTAVDHLPIVEVCSAFILNSIRKVESLLVDWRNVFYWFSNFTTFSVHLVDSDYLITRILRIVILITNSNTVMHMHEHAWCCIQIIDFISFVSVMSVHIFIGLVSMGFKLTVAVYEAQVLAWLCCYPSPDMAGSKSDFCSIPPGRCRIFIFRLLVFPLSYLRNLSVIISCHSYDVVVTLPVFTCD